MKAFEQGDAVIISARATGIVSMNQMEALSAVVVRFEDTANGERAARVVIDTPMGKVVKLVLVRQLRRA